MTAYTAVASSNGTYPPSATLTRLAAQKAPSIATTTPATPALRSSPQPQMSRIAMNSNPVVSSIVADTVIP
jgi:hypothetical protein